MLNSLDSDGSITNRLDYEVCVETYSNKKDYEKME